ncbi:tRNA (adenosine(37)-N6)-threonylcarbamoyltransferase complex transferase subunit TsaD [Aureliella helgolandensis]|uniref:tRNA N6-adenosine threonylcarbamoyltransferase n=1 Tax=Aureliella helgolandensis TaxID=2527968 RepID=A0A518GCI3_9BACT|nr:tRNA (adenosine(37)-N6)-threonylcarbamoyltransferase complex transferase subunit TsaD [Aureliella helgolandensis]QDV26311.1 tRNA N6-adenosine threonylcarbamoyltransferase [Aureliella helgolandensis]
MNVLAIETTCDETAAAVITRERHVLASAVASQEEVHERFQGVVPELAARAHLERIVPILRKVVTESGIQPTRDLAAIAVATEPGLPGSLLVGLAAAKALCVAWDKPLVAINHVQAHIYACQLGRAESIFPCVGFVVSGGHTNLYHCHAANRWKYLGGTIDDAVGEAFDKVAVMIGLPYPGGLHLSRLAAEGDATAFALPRPLLKDRSTLNMSFSGLKTAVRYKLTGTGKQDFRALELSEELRSNLAASFQQAAVDCVVGKAELALKQTGLRRLCVGGGVAANDLLRQDLATMTERLGVELLIAPKDLCTDNAVMGAIAWEKIDQQDYSPLDIDIHPGLLRGE